MPNHNLVKVGVVGSNAIARSRKISQSILGFFLQHPKRYEIRFWVPIGPVITTASTEAPPRNPGSGPPDEPAVDLGYPAVTP